MYVYFIIVYSLLKGDFAIAVRNVFDIRICTFLKTES